MNEGSIDCLVLCPVLANWNLLLWHRLCLVLKRMYDWLKHDRNAHNHDTMVGIVVRNR